MASVESGGGLYWDSTAAALPIEGGWSTPSLAGLPHNAPMHYAAPPESPSWAISPARALDPTLLEGLEVPEVPW